MVYPLLVGFIKLGWGMVEMVSGSFNGDTDAKNDTKLWGFILFIGLVLFLIYLVIRR